jgi:hypothetical protein
MVTRSQLARDIGVDRATLWRWEASGQIPAAERINQTRSGYTPEAVVAIRAYAEMAR